MKELSLLYDTQKRMSGRDNDAVDRGYRVEVLEWIKSFNEVQGTDLSFASK